MRYPVIIAAFLILHSSMFAQSKGINQLLTESCFSSYKFQEPAKRKILSLKGRPVHVKLNPLTYISAGLLFTYQRVFSEQIQADCNYTISCSEYTKACIREKGFLIGVLEGFHQLNNCYSGAAYEHCEYMVNEQMKINNTSVND